MNEKSGAELAAEEIHQHYFERLRWDTGRDKEQIAAIITKHLQSGDVGKLREALEWMDRKGGLGLDVHERIRAALASVPVEKNQCRACGKLLLAENYRVADGCPCNSARGVNHGLVPKNTCTCKECDPEQTGSTRYPVHQSGGDYGPSSSKCSKCGNRYDADEVHKCPANPPQVDTTLEHTSIEKVIDQIVALPSYHRMEDDRICPIDNRAQIRNLLKSIAIYDGELIAIAAQVVLTPNNHSARLQLANYLDNIGAAHARKSQPREGADYRAGMLRAAEMVRVQSIHSDFALAHEGAEELMAQKIERAAEIEVLKYAASLCESKNLSFKNEGYRAACDDIKTCLLAAVERLEAGEQIEATAHTQANPPQPKEGVNQKLITTAINVREALRQIKDLANINEATRAIVVSIGNQLNDAIHAAEAAAARSMEVKGKQ